MKFTIKFKNVEPNDTIQEYAYEKVKKVKKYLKGEPEAVVVASKESHLYVVDVTIFYKGFVFKARETSEDNFNAAIDLVMDIIEKQLRRSKSKLLSTKRGEKRSEKMALEEGEYLKERIEETSNPQIPRVIKTPLKDLKPFNIEDAIHEIEASQAKFIVFINAENQKVNVLYKRKDGNYGLIEP